MSVIENKVVTGIEILATPPLNTVQDLGTHNFRIYGFGPAGAMDTVALQAANALLGNARGAACIEVQMFPLTLRFTADTRFALTGGATGELDGRPLPPWWTAPAKAGQSLTVRAGGIGARAYLALRGGIDVPVCLGSRSTQPSGMGGYQGRALKRGDRLAALPVTASTASGPATRQDEFGALPPEQLEGGDAHTARNTVRVLRAGEYEQLDKASRGLLWDATWTVSKRSNRQGYRLEGPALARTTRAEMRSHPLVPGVIQLTPSGGIIVQLSDTNAAGGYPKLGVVIDADLWKLGQAGPDAQLRFADCDSDAATEASRVLEAYLGRIRHGAELWGAA